jgi:hypothetical protein
MKPRFVNVVDQIGKDFDKRRRKTVKGLLAMVAGSKVGHVEQWCQAQGFSAETTDLVCRWATSKRARKLHNALHSVKNLGMDVVTAATQAVLKPLDLEAALPYAQKLVVDAPDALTVVRRADGDGDTKTKFPRHDC